MKKIVSLIAAGVSMIAGLGCSHTGNNTGASATRGGAWSKHLAGQLDGGLVVPNGEVILFYKSGDKIVIQQCDDYTVLKRREDCNTKSGTNISKVPINDFKKLLKAALNINGDYTPEMEKKIKLFKQGKSDNTPDLQRNRANIMKDLERIRQFIETYGQTKKLQQDKEALEIELNRANQQLGADSGVASSIPDINQLIDKVVDEVVGGAELQKFVYSKDKKSFEYNILRSYIRPASISAKFVTIEHGTGAWGDDPQRSVTLTKDFDIQNTEVTQLQWFLVMGYNPSSFKNKENCVDDYQEINGVPMCPSNPVEQVSWNSVQDFIKKLNGSNDGYTYRLPTEAEWEYAARGGTKTEYSYGDGALDDYAWYSNNAGGQTHSVGSKRANPYGLYDVHGNVYEWVQDVHSRDYTNHQRDPKGPSSSSGDVLRVLRGGSWAHPASDSTSAYRSGEHPDRDDMHFVGFRLVRGN